jgi:hypothetical protein
MIKIAVIIASTRPGHNGDAVRDALKPLRSKGK